MSENKAEEPVNEAIDKTTENESTESAFTTGFGTASSWLNQGSSWGASFFNSAKEKTMTTLELVKKDLNDLGEAVTAEVNDLASAAKEGFGTASTVVRNQAQYLEKLVTPNEEEKPLPGEGNVEGKNENVEKTEGESSLNFKWMTKIVDTVTDTVKNFAMEDTVEGEDNFTETIEPKQIRKTGLSQKKLLKIQTSEETYTTEPEQSEFYERWISKFKLDEYDAEINMLLANNPSLRQMFATLVPKKVDHETFWIRYFYTIEYAEVEQEMSKSTLSQVLNVDVSKKEKGSSESSKKSSPSSDNSLVVVQEPTSPSQSDWSVCSEKNVEEIPSNDEDETKGPLTPRPSSDEKKEDGWVDWDE